MNMFKSLVKRGMKSVSTPVATTQPSLSYSRQWPGSSGTTLVRNAGDAWVGGILEPCANTGLLFQSPKRGTDHRVLDTCPGCTCDCRPDCTAPSPTCAADLDTVSELSLYPLRVCLSQCGPWWQEEQDTSLRPRSLVSTFAVMWQ